MTGEQQQVAEMERRHPGWMVWVVHRYVGGPVWCARKRDDDRRVINVDTAEAMAEALEQAAPGNAPQ